MLTRELSWNLSTSLPSGVVGARRSIATIKGRGTEVVSERVVLPSHTGTDATAYITDATRANDT